ncbi:MAG TPA: hypothetical protein VGD03_13360, partial [Frankiaceae bacterium]
VAREALAALREQPLVRSLAGTPLAVPERSPELAGALGLDGADQPEDPLEEDGPADAVDAVDRGLPAESPAAGRGDLNGPIDEADPLGLGDLDPLPAAAGPIDLVDSDDVPEAPEPAAAPPGAPRAQVFTGAPKARKAPTIRLPDAGSSEPRPTAPRAPGRRGASARPPMAVRRGGAGTARPGPRRPIGGTAPPDTDEESAD